MRNGRIILLNGASSSGKSSIGQELLALLEDPWFLVPVDGISGMRSTVHTRELDEDGIAEMLRRTRLGYHRAVAALPDLVLARLVLSALLSEYQVVHAPHLAAAVAAERPLTLANLARWLELDADRAAAAVASAL